MLASEGVWEMGEGVEWGIMFIAFVFKEDRNQGKPI